MTVYNVQNQWGGDSAEWHEGGVFNIGNRPDQHPVALNLSSGDGGQSFVGTMTYAGEGPIGCRAKRVTTNCYQVENQWGGDSAPWHDAGLFLLGARNGQNAVAFHLSSTDGGETLNGTMTYFGEGPIGVTASRSAGKAYNATNQWGGDGAPWNQGGQFVLGCRDDQTVVALEVTSSDNGATLNGTTTYSGEGPIGFRGRQIMADTYSVENQWGGDSAPWHDGGRWIIGCRGAQGVVGVDLAEPNGTMTYAGEGPIGLALVAS
jgi:hypothetical protein